ncbi:hypothetical protein KIPB_012014, partial [Kipferlia bialata]|eukprot:g12014.t1
MVFSAESLAEELGHILDASTTPEERRERLSLLINTIVHSDSEYLILETNWGTLQPAVATVLQYKAITTASGEVTNTGAPLDLFALLGSFCVSRTRYAEAAAAYAASGLVAQVNAIKLGPDCEESLEMAASRLSAAERCARLRFDPSAPIDVVPGAEEEVGLHNLPVAIERMADTPSPLTLSARALVALAADARARVFLLGQGCSIPQPESLSYYQEPMTFPARIVARLRPVEVMVSLAHVGALDRSLMLCKRLGLASARVLARLGEAVGIVHAGIATNKEYLPQGYSLRYLIPPATRADPRHTDTTSEVETAAETEE